MAAVAQHSNVLYTSSGLFLHPDRFLRRTKVVKDAKGNDVTVSSFRPGHIFNAIFDETDPLNPEKNNIEVYADIYGEKGKENCKYKVRFRDQSIKYMVLPPLAVRSSELGPNGNFGKGEKNPNKDKPEAARYSACLDGMAYDDAVKDPEDPWQRNKDYVKLEALLNRLKLWAIMYIWQSPAGKIKSQTRNFLKDMQTRDKAKDPHAADITMEEVVAQFEVNPHLCRGLVCVPQERDDATEPAESRSYIVWNRRTFAKLKTDDKKKSGYNGPSKKQIDNDPCPPGFRRMPLGILSYKIDYADRKAKARYMTRAEIDQIRRGDVMSAMVQITLGVDDKNPTNSDIYPLNMKFEGAQDDDLWFGSGHNGSQVRCVFASGYGRVLTTCVYTHRHAMPTKRLSWMTAKTCTWIMCQKRAKPTWNRSKCRLKMPRPLPWRWIPLRPWL